MEAKRVFISGGAGFIGANLCRRLLDLGCEVTVLDNFCTGRRQNIEGLKLRLIEADLCEMPDVKGTFDWVINLACPASPPAYQNLALETLRAGSQGVYNALSLARRSHARFIQSSTSEVYGEPAVHPQKEEYRGNVSCTGPRSMYDESKRFSEALIKAYSARYGISAGIVRIFNTYGPYMREDDGRVVTNFLSQAEDGKPLTVYGDGTQTRSFCFVDDLVEGLIKMAESDECGPVNLGNPTENTMLELAEAVGEAAECTPVLNFEPLPGDDPTRRCPDISLAMEKLSWQPKVSLKDGLKATLQALREFRQRFGRDI